MSQDSKVNKPPKKDKKGLDSNEQPALTQISSDAVEQLGRKHKKKYHREGRASSKPADVDFGAVFGTVEGLEDVDEHQSSITRQKNKKNLENSLNYCSDSNTERNMAVHSSKNKEICVGNEAVDCAIFQQKEKKKSKKSKRRVSEDGSCVVDAQNLSHRVEFKKDKKLKRAREDIEPFEAVGEESKSITPNDKPRKKKRKLMIEDNVVQGEDDFNTAHCELDKHVGWKSQSKKINNISNVDDSVMNENSVLKKKRKKLSTNKESVLDISLGKNSQDCFTLKKEKKKKHPNVNSENDKVDLGEAEMIAENSAKRERKLKKREKHLFDAVKDSREESEEVAPCDVVLQKVKKKKEKSKSDGDCQGCPEISNVPFRIGGKRSVGSDEGLTNEFTRSSAPRRNRHREARKKSGKELNKPCNVVKEVSGITFQFDNNALVQDYVPRRLLELNGFSKTLNVDKISLKVPELVFKGSSINSIAGYGVSLK